MSVKKDQIYAEMGGKKRYLKVVDVAGGDVTCRAGWRGRGNRVTWTTRFPIVPMMNLLSPDLFRLEKEISG